jgi:hypothetical protein
MKTFNSVEEYAEHIRNTTAPMIGRLCHRLGPEHPVTQAVSDLCTEAVNLVQQKKMQLERAAGYDLAALQVHTETPSNSETGWERDDD